MLLPDKREIGIPADNRRFYIPISADFLSLHRFRILWEFHPHLHLHATMFRIRLPCYAPSMNH